MAENPLILSSLYDRIEFDTDCACPVQPYFPNNQAKLQMAEKYRINPKLYKKWIINEFSFFYEQENPHDLTVLNAPSEKILEKFREPISINKVIKESSDQSKELPLIRELVRFNLVKSEGTAFANSIESNIRHQPEQVLTVWLHITNQCNMRCDYCYIYKTSDYMSLSIAEGAIDAAFRSANSNGFQKVKLKYAGGEPTLNFKAMRFAHEYAKSLSEDMSIDLEEVVLSNGTYLKPHIIEYLKQNQIRIMVSLDGLGAVNDQQRTFVGGRGAFHTIQKGLRLLQENHIQPMVSITVTNRNHVELPKLVCWLLEKNLPFTFNFYRENNLSEKFSDLLLEEKNMIQSIYAALSEIEANPPSYTILGMLTDRARLDAFHNHPCGVGNSYMVIDHKGLIAKCHMHIDQSITSIFEEDPLQIIRLDTKTLQNPSVDKKEGCSNCEWRYVCSGGCPALTYRLTGRSDIKSPYCNIYKSIFPRILETEAIRLLKKSNYL